MKHLSVEVAENGFVVNETYDMAMKGKVWVFETAESLAVWMKDWGKKIEEERKDEHD